LTETTSAPSAETSTTTAPRSKSSRVGIVISDKMEKTRVIAVRRTIRHAVYKKTLRRTSTFHAHDEKGVSRMGDTVRIVETRPLSKLKRWRVVEVVEKARVTA
jgi:small subunit ribosomal protein S17